MMINVSVIKLFCYCSVVCQKLHWSEGHKTYCLEATVPIIVPWCFGSFKCRNKAHRAADIEYCPGVGDVVPKDQYWRDGMVYGLNSCVSDALTKTMNDMFEGDQDMVEDLKQLMNERIITGENKGIPDECVVQ